MVLYHAAPHIRFRFRSAHLIALAAAMMFTTACTTHAPPAQPNFYAAAGIPFKSPSNANRVQVLVPLLAARIEEIAERSPSFRTAWEMIRSSGVPVRVGSYSQLRGQLPRWFRDHPTDWAGVTVTASTARGELSSAVVALRVSQIEELARRLPAGNSYVVDEIDRVLIHEIYGHLTPIIASRDLQQECPDQLRPGEQTPCVQVRERQIAAELADFRLNRARASATQ